MRPSLTSLVQWLTSVFRGPLVTGMLAGVLGWAWCSQFWMTWGTGSSALIAMGVALLVASAIAFRPGQKRSMPPAMTWLMLFAWTIACPYLLQATADVMSAPLEDSGRALTGMVTSALLGLTPGLALLMRLGAQTSARSASGVRLLSGVGCVWLVAPLTIGAWPGPALSALMAAAFCLVRFVQIRMDQTVSTEPAPTAAEEAASEAVVSTPGLVVSLVLAAACGVALTMTRWLEAHLFLPVASLQCAVWGGLILGVAVAMFRSRKRTANLSTTGFHLVCLGLAMGLMGLCVPSLIDASMAISANFSWLPAVVGIRSLLVAMAAALLGYLAGTGMVPRPWASNGLASTRIVLHIAMFLGGAMVATQAGWHLGQLMPFTLVCCMAGLACVVPGGSLRNNRRWLAPACAVPAVACAIVASPLTPLTHQRMLFSDVHYQARGVGVEPRLLTQIDGGRLETAIRGANGTASVWNHSAVQMVLRDNGMTRGVMSLKPDLCPQTRTEVLTAVLPLSIHAQPSRVLFTSAAYPTVIATSLGFPVVEMTALEADPAMLELGRAALKNFEQADERVTLIHADPVRGLASTDRQFDVVIDPDSIVGPIETARRWSTSHYQQVANHLAENGLFCQRLTCFDLSVGTIEQVLRNARAIFPTVQLTELSPGEWLLLARMSDSMQIDSDFLNRLSGDFIRSTLAQAGWDYSITLSLRTIHPQDMDQAVASGSMLPADPSRMAYALPLDVMKWAAKHDERHRWLSRTARPLGDALGEDPGMIDVGHRMNDVKLSQQILIDHPDQFWAYRKYVKKRLQERPRPKVIQVAGEGLKNGRDPEDTRRMEFLKSFGKAVETRSRTDVDELLNYLTPFDPLVTPFIPREYVQLDKQSESPNTAAQFYISYRSVYFSPPGDRSVANICDALDLLKDQPELVGSPMQQWDYTNALMEALKNRWVIRTQMISTQKYDVADAERSIDVAVNTLEAMDKLHQSAGIPAADWEARKEVLDQYLIKPMRAWRSQESSRLAMEAAAARDPKADAKETAR